MCVGQPEPLAAYLLTIIYISTCNSECGKLHKTINTSDRLVDCASCRIDNMLQTKVAQRKCLQRRQRDSSLIPCLHGHLFYTCSR